MYMQQSYGIYFNMCKKNKKNLYPVKSTLMICKINGNDFAI